MASKSAQPDGQVDVEELLDYIDKTMERLKTLYEQYFLGMQKQAPAHIHNDIERRIRDLMQIQIRNTGLRYRFATLQQKFGSYNSYWRRTLRQIEMGTYIRQLQKIGRKAAQSGEEIPEEILAAMPKRMREQVKRDREQALAIAARRAHHSAGEGDVDVDLGLEDEPAVIGESNTVRNAVRKNQHVLSEADGDLDIDAFFASVSDDTNPDAKPFAQLEDDDEPTGYGPPPQHVAAPPARQPAPPPQQAARPTTLPSSNQGRPGQPMPRAGQPGAPQQGTPMPGQRPPQPAIAQPGQRPSQPVIPPPGQRPSQPVMQGQPMPGQRPSQPVMPTQQPPRSAPLQGGWADPPQAQQPPQQRPSQPAMPAQPFPPQPQQPSQAGVKFVSPQRAGTQPGIMPAQARQTGPIPVIPAPSQTSAIPTMRPQTAPSQITRPNPIAPGASQQRPQTNVESMQGPFPRAQTQQPPGAPGPGGAPPRPQQPRPVPPGARTPPPEMTGPPLRPPPGMNDADVNALYAKYVKAKQAVGEDAGPGAYGKLLKTINSQAPKIMEQYKAKGVEFSVVVKDNQVIIKAKPKP